MTWVQTEILNIKISWLSDQRWHAYEVNDKIKYYDYLIKDDIK